jgi:hypothetical protein
LPFPAWRAQSEAMGVGASAFSGLSPASGNSITLHPRPSRCSGRATLHRDDGHTTSRRRCSSKARASSRSTLGLKRKITCALTLFVGSIGWARARFRCMSAIGFRRRIGPKPKAPAGGVEPPIVGLTGRRLTVGPRRILLHESGRWDSNPRSPAPDAGGLARLSYVLSVTAVQVTEAVLVN